MAAAETWRAYLTEPRMRRVSAQSGIEEQRLKGTVVQALKQRTARGLVAENQPCHPRQTKLFAGIPERGPFWQARFYDLNVW